MTDSNETPLQYYSTPGRMTNPGSFSHLLQDLPDDIGSLCQVVQGLMVHIFWAERYGLTLNATRKEEVQIRPLEHKLERIIELDPRPLTEERSLEKKLVGNCRDFSLLLAGFLQHKGIPARARCGFARYFRPGLHEDHWVCETWDATEKQWVLIDAQLDEFQRQALHIRFDPLNVPRTMFFPGGKAWQVCRSGGSNPDKFGIFDMRGMWFICGDFIRDVAALNKMELLPWDGWGLIDKDYKLFTDEDFNFLDKLAEQCAGDVPEIETIRELYDSDERLRVPNTITTYLRSGAQKIDLFS